MLYTLILTALPPLNPADVKARLQQGNPEAVLFLESLKNTGQADFDSQIKKAKSPGQKQKLRRLKKESAADYDRRIQEARTVLPPMPLPYNKIGNWGVVDSTFKVLQTNGPDEILLRDLGHRTAIYHELNKVERDEAIKKILTDRLSTFIIKYPGAAESVKIDGRSNLGCFVLVEMRKVRTVLGTEVEIAVLEPFDPKKWLEEQK